MSAQEKLIGAARRFELACDIPCMALDDRSNELFINARNSHKSLCAMIMEASSATRLPCRHVHHYGCMQALEHGGKFLYYCPMGLMHFISPLVADGRLLGSLVGGPVILCDKEDYLHNSALKKYTETKIGKDTLDKLAKSLICVSPERAAQLCEMLSVTVYGVGAELSGNIGRRLKAAASAAPVFIPENYPISAERQLLTAISLGHREVVLAQLQAWLERLSDSSLPELTACGSELITLAARTAVGSGADEKLTLENSRALIAALQASRSRESAVETLREMASVMSEHVYKLQAIRHNDALFKALTYIMEHYSERITLDDVAAAAYLSPTYFSKIFKEEMNVSFSQHLNRVRIDAGKRLLRSTGLPMSAISEQVGFGEQGYFTKVFKRLTGITPLRYRDNFVKT